MQDDVQETANDTTAAAGDAAPDTTTVPGETIVAVPDHIAAQLPAGTQVGQMPDGTLTATVPIPAPDPATGNAFHRIVTDVEHSFDALVAKVKAFFAADAP